jgi:xylulokinase
LARNCNNSQHPGKNADSILSIDLGTSGCKCAVVSLKGEVVAWEFARIETRIIGQGGAEQDPADWWQAFRDTARRVVRKAGEQSWNIAAVCASTQGEGTVAVDRHGDLLHPAILWLDMRGRDAVRRQAGNGLLKLCGYNVRKLFQWIRLCGGAPALSGKDPAAHMLFIRQKRPQVYQQTDKFLSVLDYLNYRLTGRMAATPDSILTSWVTDNRDPANVVYHEGLIRALGLDLRKFPEIVQSTSVIGSVISSVAVELGLSEGTPVVAGSIDTSAAAIGSGAVEDGQAHLYIGTSSWFGAHVPEKKTDLRAHIASVPCARTDKYLMIALQSAAGANLSFLRDQVFQDQNIQLEQEERPDVYRLLDKIASQVPAGAHGIVYTPWLFGERTPVDDATVRASLLNVSMQHTRADMIRAVLEGVALNTRWMLESVRRFLRRYPVDEVTIVGGGGASDLWCQIFADVMNIRVRQVEMPLQTNVLGAAFIASVGIEALSFDDVGRLIRTKNVYLPNPRNRQVYDAAFVTPLSAGKSRSMITRKVRFQAA